MNTKYESTIINNKKELGYHYVVMSYVRTAYAFMIMMMIIQVIIIMIIILR